MLTLERLANEEKVVQQGIATQRAALLTAALADEELTLAELEQVGWSRHDLAQAMEGARRLTVDLKLVTDGELASDRVTEQSAVRAALVTAHDEERRRLQLKLNAELQSIDTQMAQDQSAVYRGNDARVRIMERRPAGIVERLKPLEQRCRQLMDERRRAGVDAAERRSVGAFEQRHQKTYDATIERIDSELRELTEQQQAIELEVFAMDAVDLVV